MVSTMNSIRSFPGAVTDQRGSSAHSSITATPIMASSLTSCWNWYMPPILSVCLHAQLGHHFPVFLKSLSTTLSSLLSHGLRRAHSPHVMPFMVAPLDETAFSCISRVNQCSTYS